MEDYVVIYAIVPKYIYETKKLTPEDKLIAERIIYLCKKEGYCWITNKSLAEIYNITVETASRHIKKLEQIGLIKCIYDYNDKKTKRVIRLVDNIWTNWSNRDKSNNQKSIDQGVKHNNKYNNISEYKSNTPDWFNMDYEKKIPTPDEQREFDELLKEFE
jgi:DNA-binding Lrp family transcriptional regulator